MGNNFVVGLEENEVTLKNGEINSSVPFPVTSDHFETLLQTPSLKDYLVANLDDDYLIDSLFSDDPKQSLLSGFDAFKSSSEEELQKLSSEMTSMQDCAQAGLQVS